jgi:hypothetical protein
MDTNCNGARSAIKQVTVFYGLIIAGRFVMLRFACLDTTTRVFRMPKATKIVVSSPATRKGK